MRVFASDRPVSGAASATPSAASLLLPTFTGGARGSPGGGRPNPRRPPKRRRRGAGLPVPRSGLHRRGRRLVDRRRTTCTGCRETCRSSVRLRPLSNRLNPYGRICRRRLESSLDGGRMRGSGRSRILCGANSGRRFRRAGTMHRWSCALPRLFPDGQYSFSTSARCRR